jgi:hypothetical protein
MSVRRGEDGTTVLEGVCPVGDAEVLLQHVLADPRAAVDWRGCTQLHTAVVQVVWALRPPLRGPCGVPFIERWLALPGRADAVRGT